MYGLNGKIYQIKSLLFYTSSMRKQALFYSIFAISFLRRKMIFFSNLDM